MSDFASLPNDELVAKVRAFVRFIEGGGETGRVADAALSVLAGRLQDAQELAEEASARDAKQEAEDWKQLALDMGEQARSVSAYLRAIAHDGLHRGTQLEKRYEEWADDLDALLARLDGLAAGKETA